MTVEVSPWSYPISSFAQIFRSLNPEKESPTDNAAELV